MKIEVLFFGLVAEKLNKQSLTLNLKEEISLGKLIFQLKETYKELHDIQFQTALNEQIVSLQETVKSDCTIALLPPFAGG